MPTALSAHMDVLACRDILFSMHDIMLEDASSTRCVKVCCSIRAIRNATRPEPACRVFTSISAYQEYYFPSHQQTHV